MNEIKSIVYLVMRLKIVLLLVLSSPMVLAANITVKLDRNPVLQDETFHLTYEAESDVDGSPDFKPIYKDFDVLNSSQSTNMRLVNGNYSLKKSWDLTLISSKAGTFTIPSIAFGKDFSPAVQVTVAKNASHAKTINKAEVFVEVTTDKKSAFIESEIIYTARLVRTIEMAQITVSELKVSDPDAIVVNLGNIPQYTRTRDGKRYVVNEIRYAVFPQHSGKLSFEPLLFEGRIGQNNARSLFDQFFQTGRVKRIRTKALSIDIKPKPDNIKTFDWLPAKQLSLHDEWSGNLQEINVGEPITRTITINAKGYTAEQLPDIDLDKLKNIKQYPDQAVLENSNSANGVSASKQIKIAIIPTAAGSYEIPEITIPWWNTSKNRAETAKLPGRILKAIGETAASDEKITPAATEMKVIEKPIIVESSAELQSQSNIWPLISLFLATGWAVSVLYFLIKTKKVSVELPKREKPKPSKRHFHKQIKKACREDNPNATKDALIAWAKTNWEDETIHSLIDIANRVTPAFADVISQLNTALYGTNKSTWKGEYLLRQYELYKKKTRKNHQIDSTPLEPLYK